MRRWTEHLELSPTNVGEEEGELRRLAAAGLPFAPAFVLEPGPAAERNERIAAMLAALPESPALRLRPLLATRAESLRFLREAALLRDVPRDDALGETLLAAFAFASGPSIRAIPCGGPESVGRAASSDPLWGAPDELAVWSRGSEATPWRIDRRSGRVVQPGAALDVLTAEAAADLADRVQLLVGHPVEIEWMLQDGRPVLISVRPLALNARYPDGPWSRLALMDADEGTVAPLAIDVLNRGLRQLSPEPPAVAVRRIYARPYRCWEAPVQPLGRPDPASLREALSQGRGLLRDVLPLFQAVENEERSMAGWLQEQERVVLRTQDDEGLLSVFDERHHQAAETLALLDRCRAATRQLLAALEAVVGGLPRECYAALAAPQVTKQRRRAHKALVNLRRRVLAERGDLDGPEGLSADGAANWDQLRQQLATMRLLGIDVTPEPMGASDRSLSEAMEAARREGHVAREKARKDARRRVLHRAKTEGFRRVRRPLAASLVVMLGRVAVAKGQVSEQVAGAMLLLRSGALEVGRRLVEQAILDAPEDAFYLKQRELLDALGGEPGSYASRVRVRREDDMRWSAYDAPRRLSPAR